MHLILYNLLDEGDPAPGLQRWYIQSNVHAYVLTQLCTHIQSAYSQAYTHKPVMLFVLCNPQDEGDLGTRAAEKLKPFCAECSVNVINCSSVPPHHIGAIRAMAASYPPRKVCVIRSELGTFVHGLIASVTLFPESAFQCPLCMECVYTKLIIVKFSMSALHGVRVHKINHCKEWKVSPGCHFWDFSKFLVEKEECYFWTHPKQVIDKSSNCSTIDVSLGKIKLSNSMYRGNLSQQIMVPANTHCRCACRHLSMSLILAWQVLKIPAK